MTVAALFNVPSTTSELNIWSFAHAAHHRDMARVILQQSGFRVSDYVLDPIDVNRTGVWNYQHQLLHQAINFALGIQGYNLTDVNWSDQNELAAWIALNGDEHRRAGNILRLG